MAFTSFVAEYNLNTRTILSNQEKQKLSKYLRGNDDTDPIAKLALQSHAGGCFVPRE